MYCPDLELFNPKPQNRSFWVSYFFVGEACDHEQSPEPLSFAALTLNPPFLNLLWICTLPLFIVGLARFLCCRFRKRFPQFLMLLSDPLILSF